MPNDAEDRREHPRAPNKPPLEVKVTAARTVSAIARDISKGGMLLEAEMAPPKIGSELQLKFRLPGEKERTLIRAAVVRHAPGGLFGVKFLRLAADQLAALDRYVNAQLTD